MSKKNTTIVESASTEIERTSATLQAYFNDYENLSLRKLAAATSINYGVLLKASKEPIVGEAYDPSATNWNAIAIKLMRKNVHLEDIDWEALNAPANRAAGMLSKDIEDFKVGDKVYLRRDNITPYEIVYKTETHIVIMKEGTSEPQAWSISTFMLNGPMFQPRATKVVDKEVQ